MSFSLLVLLFICHWLADYTHLQTAWMLKAKSMGKPLWPIAVHAGAHALLQGIVLLFFVSIQSCLYLMAFQWVTHFCIDVWKGRMNGWFPELKSPVNQWHWIVFGFDQLLHQIVIVLMVWYAGGLLT